MEQVPLRRVLDYSCEGDGKYVFEFPLSVCFGSVVSGGIVSGAVHKAAADFVSQSSRTAHFKDMIDISTQFYRPTLSAPKETIVQLRLDNTTKVGVTLHVEVKQKAVCIVGYVTYNNPLEHGLNHDFCANDVFRMGTFIPNQYEGLGCMLFPEPTTTTTSKLENDEGKNWFANHVPFSVAGVRAGSTYIKYHLERNMRSHSFCDHWITPNWEDNSLSNGPVWTNERVHFLVDSSFALWIDPQLRTRIHENSVRVGDLQKKARQEGKSEIIEGGQIPLPYMAASMFITTAIKKLLPAEGTKWIFMRALTTGHSNNRIDYYIILMDADGEVIATSMQVMKWIPLSGKDARL